MALQPSSPIAYNLSGSEATALNSALQGKTDDLAGATIRIGDNASSVAIEIVSNTGKATSFSVDKRTGAVSANESATNPTNSIALPGLEAKAIVVAYRSWLSGTTKSPAARADLTAGAFTVAERAFLSPSTNQKPGYFVTYLPSESPPTNSGMHCGNFTNYRVDPMTWQVFIQPKIC